MHWYAHLHPVYIPSGVPQFYQTKLFNFLKGKIYCNLVFHFMKLLKNQFPQTQFKIMMIFNEARFIWYMYLNFKMAKILGAYYF